MPEVSVRVAVLLLSLAFAWAAAAKVLAYDRWRSILVRYGLPGGSARIAAPVVPIAELAAAVILWISPWLGAIYTVLLLSLFSLAILRARQRNGDRLPCGCFGGSEERHYALMLWRNGLMGALAALVFFTPESDKETAIATLSSPSSGEILPVVLVVVGVVLVLWVAWQAVSSFRHREHP